MLVTKLDHIFVPLADAAGAHRWLTETLALPVAWPFTEYAAFASGGVVLGSINFEVLQSSPELPNFTARRPARVQGIAFEPTPIDDAFLAELDRRSIPHSPAMPFTGSGHGHTGLLWTNVFFPHVVDERTMVFVCDYRIPDARDVAARRAALAAVRGGVLGIEDVETVVVASPDPTVAAARWQRLFDPLTQAAPGRWQVGSGPMIRLVAGTEDAVEHLVVRVRSLDLARDGLARSGVRCDDADGDLVVRPEPLAGLALRLVA